MKKRQRAKTDSSDENEYMTHGPNSFGPKKKRLWIRRLGGLDVEFTRQQVETGFENLLESPLNVENSQYGQLSWLEKVQRHTNYLELKKLVKPDFEPKLTPLIDLQSTGSTKKLHCQVLERSVKRERITIKVKVTGQSAVAVGEQSCLHTFTFGRGSLSEESLSKLELYLCNAMERLSFVSQIQPLRYRTRLDVVLKSAMTKLLGELDEDNLQPMGTPLAIRRRRSRAENGNEKEAIDIPIRVFEPSGNLKLCIIMLRPHLLRMEVPANPVPKYAKFNESDPPKYLEKEDLDRYKRAVEHARYLSFTCDGTIASKNDLHAFAGAYITSRCHMKSRIGSHPGPYQGRRHVKVSRVSWTSHATMIGLGDAVTKDLKVKEGFNDDELPMPRAKILKLPAIRIRTVNNRRSNRVLEVLDNIWASELNILRAYIEAARACDIENRIIDEAEPEPVQCGCIEGTQSYQLHPCGICDQSVPCETMGWAKQFETRCCANCLIGEISYTLHSRRRMHRTIRRAGRRERLLGGNTNSSDLLIQYVEGMPSVRDWVTYEDDIFRGRVRAYPKEDEPLVRSAFQPSFDATRPFVRTHEGRTGVHVPGNVGFTALWLNYASSLFPKGSLCVLRDYLNGKMAPQLFFQKICDINIMAGMIPYQTAARIGREMSAAQMELFDRYWRELRLDDRTRANAAAIVRRLRAIQCSDCPDWRPRDLTRINGMVESVIDHFSPSPCSRIHLPRSSDGCPYPFEPAFMPEDWGWWKCWCFFAEKVKTLWLLCNGQWVQKDDIEMIFIRCIIEWCSYHSNKTLPSHRLWDLPINLWKRSIIRLSIGHKIHGRPLVSGLARRPRTIDDWDPQLDNMSIETCVENWAKSNFDPDEYPAIKEELMTIEMPLTLYDPASEVSQVSGSSDTVVLDRVQSNASAAEAQSETRLMGIYRGEEILVWR